MKCNIENFINHTIVASLNYIHIKIEQLKIKPVSKTIEPIVITFHDPVNDFGC